MSTCLVSRLRAGARRLAAALFFPGVLALGVASTWALLQRGVRPGTAALIPVLGTLAAVLGAERIFPYLPDWNRSRGDTGPDVLSALTLRVPEALAAGLGQAVSAFLGVSAVAALESSRWPSPWPFAAQFLGILLVADLGKYTMHRLSHERPWLWRFHAMHHQPERVYSLNGLRIHPVNMFYNLFFDVTVPLALGVDARVMAMVAVVRGIVSVFQHANLHLALGPLSWIFSTNELHRWHHSTDVAEGTTNYGSTLIVWDVLFGTRALPAGRPHPRAVGIDAPRPLPRSWLGQLVWPFCGDATTVSCGPARWRWLLQ